MQKNKYGTQDSMGWENSHVYPLARGGDDELINLIPMQWQNNRNKSNSYPSYQCSVKAEGNKNVPSEETRIINELLQKELRVKYKMEEGSTN
jgi:hypothetical protein